MAIKTKLPKSVVTIIEALGNDVHSVPVADIFTLTELLEAFVEDQNEARGDKSEKWLESDKGSAHDEFISQCQNILDAVSSVKDTLESTDFSLPTCED